MRYLLDSSFLWRTGSPPCVVGRGYLLICATAAPHDLVVLHDDKDFATAARYVPDVRERTIHDAPHDRPASRAGIC
jgi:predicted nucleic acid-binding protein